ncbi:MAG: DUF1501 domain-containing protein, partial [Fuerstiella sp.]|nr:DUF1501 domain-containing protein [Fuerstiella sp.]
MLTVTGSYQSRFCDGVTRRSFLRAGTLGASALCLPDLLQADELNRGAGRDQSVVMIYLPGGPTQHETFDPKPRAPQDIRGSFQPVSTAVPGTQFCELLPKLAAMSD